jgi:preprotein translocase subunit SecG
MYYVFLGIYALVCFLLLVVVLLQQGKGGDIAAAFGGSSSQAAFGARAGATVLTRATSILGALFMLGALALAVALIHLCPAEGRGTPPRRLRGGSGRRTHLRRPA